MFITIAAFIVMVPIGLIFSIYDSTEVVIQKMIEASQRIITVGSSNEVIKGVPLRGMNPATKRHLELQIKTLQNAPRDPDKLERLLKSKRRQNEEEVMYFEETERIVTEIEMLKVVLYLVSRDKRKKEDA